jgi:hypothetical protein
MSAALLGGTLASGPGIAWAAPRPRPDGKKCKTDSQCQSGNCAGGVCQNSQPVCTPRCKKGGLCYATTDGTTACGCGFDVCTNDCSACAPGEIREEKVATVGAIIGLVAGAPGFFL